jgi:uncharacterized membrane protein YbhN (UPF0104 family)
MKDRFINAVSGRSVYIIRLIGTLVALILLVYLLSQQGWEQILNAFRRIPIWILILSQGLIFISRFNISGRWHVLLRSTGAEISVRQSTRITFAGLFASNFLPTTIGGDVVRLAGVLQLNIDSAVSTASLIVDRLVGMAGMGMVLLISIPVLLSNRIFEGLDISASYLGLPTVAAISIGHWWKKLRDSSVRFLCRLKEALSIWISHPRGLLKSLGYTWVHMLCIFGSLWLLLWGLGEDVSFIMVGGLYSIVYFITLLPLSINGYGIQEVAMMYMLSSVGEVSMQSGLTVALLFRTMMILASIPGAFFLSDLLPGAKVQTNDLENGK